jgi:hypothetical protein
MVMNYELGRMCKEAVIKGKGKVVSLLFLTEHHAMKTYWGSAGIVPRILDIGTGWR